MRRYGPAIPPGKNAGIGALPTIADSRLAPDAQLREIDSHFLRRISDIK